MTWRNLKRGSQQWLILGTVAFLLVAVLAAFWPIVLGHKTFWFYDAALFDYPDYFLLKRVLTSRDFSPVIWNSNLGAGFTLLADGEIGALYPLNWITLGLFEPRVAYNVNHIIHYFLVVVFTFAYARAMGLRRSSSVISALAFSFSGHLVGAMAANSILHSTVWLPLMFWGVETFVSRRKFVYLASASVGVAMQVLGGYEPIAALGAVAVAGYGVFRWLDQSKSFLPVWSLRGVGRFVQAGVVVALIGVIGLGLTAVQVLPQLELVSRSPRTYVSYDYATIGSLMPIQLGTMIWPLMFYNPIEKVVWGGESLGRTAIYVGILPLMLAAVAVLGKRRPRWVIYFTLFALAALILALGRYTPLYRLVYALPGFHNFRNPGTFGYWFDWSLAVLAGYGMDLLLTKADLLRGRRLFVLVGVLLALIVPVIAWQITISRWAASGQLAQAMEPLRPWMKPDKDPALLLRSIQASADPRQLTALMPILMLVSAAIWMMLSRTRLSRRIWAWCGAGLVAIDVVFFSASILETQITTFPAAQFKPWVADALRDQPEPYRTAVTWNLYPWYNSHQPNRLMADDIPTLQVYSQLLSKRLSLFLTAARETPSIMAKLLGLASTQYALDTETQSYAGVPFIVRRPLAEVGLWRDARAEVALPVPLRAERVQVIFAATAWGAVDQGDLARVTLVRKSGQEQSWTLSSDVTAPAEALIPARRIDLPVLRDPLGWRGDDFSAQEWPLYYAEISLSPAASVARVIVMPRQQVTLYLLGLAVNSATENWTAGELPFQQGGLSLVYQHPHGAIYTVDGALPRAYVVHRVQVVSDTLALPALLDPSFDPQRQAIVEAPGVQMEQLDLLREPSPQEVEAVRITAYAPMRVDLETDLAAPGLVVLTDSEYPGWQAWVDGVRQPIVTANYLFRGVYVDAGRHRVSFVYAPDSIRLGMVVSLTTAVGVMMLLSFEFMQHRRRGVESA